MPGVTLNFTPDEVKDILQRHVEREMSSSMPGMRVQSVSFEITKGSQDPREPSWDHLSSVRVVLSPQRVGSSAKS